MSLHDAQEPMDPGDFGPKHRMFLCHSGAQRGFVEQLDKDLRSVDRYPFFDKDKGSLPIGDNFPTLIFEAIEHCQVGVVFLSEEFFMQSHWPMFEVVKMVECGRRVMPIFLGISPGDLSNEEKVAEWKLKWEAWAKVNRRIDVAKWESTLRSLRPLNGLVYNHAIGEVKFREEIVKEVCKIVRAFHVWDDSHVQGKFRISKVIQVKIAETSISKKGVQVVGLYGVGGIGKTTACKCLCKDLALEFEGRVCHIEFGDDTKEIDRVREVLKRLTSTNNEYLKDKILDECWSQLKGALRLKKAVLAIDNVSTKSKICEGARKYLRLEYGKGSIVMVTARALGELEKLGIKMDNCLAMPELVIGEARDLFLYHAEPEKEVDEEVVTKCIRRCHFGKGDGNGSKHYHPLTLKVLASQLHGSHPSEWKSRLEKEDVFNQVREDENEVFSILGTSFDALKREDQMLFMDVALFDDGVAIRNLSSMCITSAGRILTDEVWSWYTIFDWLSMVHGLSVDEVKKRLNDLKRKSLLEELGDGIGQIGMHDLWREFAVMKAKLEEENSKWVYEDHAVCGEGTVESCMSGGGWKSLRRICIENGRIKSMNFNECSKVTVLRLRKVYVENGVLDLSRLKSIKSLEIDNRFNFVCAQDGGKYKQQEVSGIGQLLNLVVLMWLNINGEFVSAVEEISCLTNLRILHLSCYSDSNDVSSTSLDLEELIHLQNVRVSLPNMVSISGFNSKMKGLRILDLENCHKLRRCVGVGDVDSLEVLLLKRCKALEELPNLQKLKRLQILDMGWCGLRKALLGLGSLVALQELFAQNCLLAMKELPDMSKLTKLEVLDLRGCYKLKCIPGLSDLVALRVLRVRCHMLHNLSNLRNLQKLQEVVITGSDHGNENDSELGCRVSQSVVNLAMLESVPTLEIWSVDCELMNLNKLTALKSLLLDDCKFERLPNMSNNMRLESLLILSCSRLRGLDGVQGLEWGPDFQLDLCCNWTLSYLLKVEVHECKSLEVIDLSHFPHLRTLILFESPSHLSGSTKFVLVCPTIHMHLDTLDIWGLAIKDLPDLRKFPSLRDLEIRDCHELSSLTLGEPLLALSKVVFIECKKLRTIPNINFIPRLTSFEFECCGVPLSEHEVERLETRGFRKNGYGRYLLPSRDVIFLPAVDHNCRADEEVAMDAPNDLDVASEPCTSKFVPCDESLSEFGRSHVPKGALEVGSSNGTDEEQTEKLIHDEFVNLFL